MNRWYWRVLVFCAAWLHFSSHCMMTTKHNCNQSCTFLQAWMDMVPDLPAVFQSAAAIVAVWGFSCEFLSEAYGSFLSEKWSRVKQPLAFHGAAHWLTISSTFINDNWVKSRAVVERWIISFIAHCKVGVPSTVFHCYCCYLHKSKLIGIPTGAEMWLTVFTHWMRQWLESPGVMKGPRFCLLWQAAQPLTATCPWARH